MLSSKDRSRTHLSYSKGRKAKTKVGVHWKAVLRSPNAQLGSQIDTAIAHLQELQCIGVLGDGSSEASAYNLLK